MNKVRCNKCLVTIESKHRHDFKTCECGHVSIDGGKDYERRLWNGAPDWYEIDRKGKETYAIFSSVFVDVE